MIIYYSQIKIITNKKLIIIVVNWMYLTLILIPNMIKYQTFTQMH